MAEAGVGTTIDHRYMLRREIAHGAMGRVFEARHLFTGRSVAIKLLHPGSSEPLRERLLREIRVLGAVRHPNIVEVLDAGTIAGEPYLAMEMLEGRTLDGILTARRTLSVADTVHIGRQVCEALAFAHVCGFAHRDIKPSNVFVARTAYGEEVVKIVDFGIAALEDAPKAAGGSKLTQSGEVLGTPEYMAPEQLLAKDDIDARCDIYAVGVLLYECLTGQVPFTGNYPEVLLKVAQAAKAPSPRSIRPDLDPGLSAAIERALARAPSDRFPSVSAFARAFVGACAMPPGRSLLVGVPPPVPARPAAGRRHAPVDPAAAVAAPDPVALAPTPPRPRVQEDPGAQRRRYARAPYVTPVRIVSGDQSTLDGRSEDISEGGMLVITPRPCNDGEKVHVRFASPTGGHIVVVLCISRWVRMARDGKGAVGLEFVELAQHVRVSIAEHVRLMSAPPRG
ncbi:MAG: serine/threonine-protein kinase [Polyangiaceae bacterium]